MCEHNNPTPDSEPLHHLNNHLNNSFNSFISANASNDKWKKKNLEAKHIALRRHKLNNQVKHNKRLLFRNGIILSK